MAWDFLATLSATVLIVGMVAKEYLPIWVALPMMIVFVIFRAVARAIGGVTKLVYYVFTISFFGIIAFFALLKGGWGDMFSILGGVIGGGIETIIMEIGKLAGEGHVAIYLAGVAIVVLFSARWLGLELGSTIIYYWVFSIGAPIFVLLIFLVSMSHGSLREAFLIGGGLLGLLVLLQAIYLMFFWVFKKNKTR